MPRKIEYSKKPPKCNCRFLAAWTVNGELWCSTFEMRSGILFEFSPDQNLFVKSHFRFNRPKIKNLTITKYKE